MDPALAAHRSPGVPPAYLPASSPVQGMMIAPDWWGRCEPQCVTTTWRVPGQSLAMPVKNYYCLFTPGSFQLQSPHRPGEAPLVKPGAGHRAGCGTLRGWGPLTPGPRVRERGLMEPSPALLQSLVRSRGFTSSDSATPVSPWHPSMPLPRVWVRSGGHGSLDSEVLCVWDIPVSCRGAQHLAVSFLGGLCRFLLWPWLARPPW